VVDVNGGVVAAWIVAILVLLVLGGLLWLWLRSARQGGAAPLAVDALDPSTGAPTQLAADAARAQAAAAALDVRSFEQAMETTALDEVRETGGTDEPDQRP
jgi:hypothetical protein